MSANVSPSDPRPPVVPDVRRLTILACTLLVILRFCIGWQFFYEGMWKQHSLTGPDPWTASGYLKSAQGPFRSTFRGLVNDPDDLEKLDFDKVVADWTDWKNRFVAHYPDLTADQKTRLDERFLELKEGKFKVNADGKPELDKKGLRQWLVENPDWIGVTREQYKGTLDEKTIGQIELYKAMLARYEADLRNVQVGFQQDHLEQQWAEIQEKRKELVGPINVLTAELHGAARGVLTVEQLGRGPSPERPTQLSAVNHRTIWALLILGGLLMLGLFSRTAAFGAACLLTLFYLPVPPWPGVPQPPGPEHSLIVNKNFIEIIACLALASMPTGRWAGLDALIHRFILRKTTD